MANNAPNNPFEGVAKGLNSPELKSNKTIPFVDECVELDQVKNETTRPKTLDIRKHEMEDEKPQTLKEDKIHAKDLGAVHTPNSDTIVVNTPEGTLYITLDPESKSSPTSPNTQSTDVSESPSTSKAFGAQESNDMIIMEKEVEQRRAGLRRNSISMPTLQNLESEVLKQHYLGNPEEGVCAVRVIAESEWVQEFLTEGEESCASPVELKVLLPDRSVVAVSVARSANADHVYRAVCDKIALDNQLRPYFYLFEIVEYNFERKLQGNECPHSLYVQNYSTASASCVCVRKWLFNPRRDAALVRAHPAAAAFLFWQAVEEVNRGVISAGNRLYQLKALQEVRRAGDYLALARALPGYGDVVFPPATTDCRATPALVLAIGWSGLKLSAWSEGAEGAEVGAGQGEAVQVSWREVREWRADDAAAAARITYRRPGNSDHTTAIALYTPYYQFLCNCMDRIAEEASWSDTGE